MSGFGYSVSSAYRGLGEFIASILTTKENNFHKKKTHKQLWFIFVVFFYYRPNAFGQGNRKKGLIENPFYFIKIA